MILISSYREEELNINGVRKQYDYVCAIKDMNE